MLMNKNEMENIIVLHSWYSTSLSTIGLLYKYFNKTVYSEWLMSKHMVFPEWNFVHELENYILRTIFVIFLSIQKGILEKQNEGKFTKLPNKFLKVRLIGLIHLFRAHVMYLCKCIDLCLWSRLVVLSIFIFIFLFSISQFISSAPLHLGGPEGLVWSMAWEKK